MSTTHLMSLHPVHAHNMLDGGKTIEWRRRWPNVVQPGDRLVIYATAPVSAMVGEVQVAAVHRGAPEALWARHQAAGMVDESLFRRYMGDLAQAVAVEVAHPQRWAQPVTLDDLKHLTGYSFHPPQTTARIDSQQVDRFRQWARWSAIGHGRCAWNDHRSGPLTEDDLDWIKQTLVAQRGASIVTWWNGVREQMAQQRNIQALLQRDQNDEDAVEYGIHVLFVNQSGDLDGHGRPPRARAGFLVLRTPGFPKRFDENDQPIGECAIDAWFVEPWAQTTGWTQHLFAYAMAAMGTVTPACRILDGVRPLVQPLVQAMGWTMTTNRTGDTWINPMLPDLDHRPSLPGPR